MQELKAETPLESPADTNAAARLIQRLSEEGFTSEASIEDWEEYGEIIFRRGEKLPLTSGSTWFIFTRVPEVNERMLRQTSDAVVNTFKAQNAAQKALSVLQSTTVYHCLVCTSDTPHNDPLNEYIRREGGATFIPVLIIPGINQVLYPTMDEKVGTIQPRVEYLQYLLNERREPVNMHRSTIHAFYVSVAVVALLVLAVVFSLFT